MVVSKNTTATKGLNFAEIKLETDESFVELLSEDQKEDYKESENGDYHLVAGEYTIRVTIAGNSEETSFKIKNSSRKA